MADARFPEVTQALKIKALAKSIKAT